MLSFVGPADVRSPYKLHLHICCDKRVALSCVISQRTFPPLPGTWCSSAAVILSFQNSVGCLGRWSREFSKHIGKWEHSTYTSCCSGKWSILFIMGGPSSCNNAIYGLFFMFCRLDDRKTASNSWERSAQGLMPWCESRTPWAARGQYTCPFAVIVSEYASNYSLWRTTTTPFSWQCKHQINAPIFNLKQTRGRADLPDT